jgi:hypothetical protein
MRCRFCFNGLFLIFFCFRCPCLSCLELVAPWSARVPAVVYLYLLSLCFLHRNNIRSAGTPAAARAPLPRAAVLAAGSPGRAATYAAVQLHLTPAIFEGLLTGLVLLATAAGGFYCLCAIQTPDRFETPPRIKEQ